MIVRLLSVALLAGAFSAPAIAEEDDLVRLPGQGEVKPERAGHLGKVRLAPGGGLMVSFDADNSGTVTMEEVSAGITAAFLKADANEDGELTPLEQQAWAESLPTRDDTLANPTRFDPNLDRVVSADEFDTVIRTIATTYAAEGNGVIELATLKSTARPERADPDADREELRRWRERQKRQRTGVGG